MIFDSNLQNILIAALARNQNENVTDSKFFIWS